MEFREFLDGHFDVAEVAGGRQWKLAGTCPFCNESRRDLRLYVDPDSGEGFCHHCGQGFGPEKLVMAIEGVTYRQAFKLLHGGNASVFKREPEEKPVLKDSVWWPQLVELEKSPAALDYLAGRGMPAGLQRHFRIHFCPADTEVEDRVYPTANRVVVPIFDIAGSPIGWQGRSIGGGFPKYFTPPSFKKGEVLFNANGIPDGAPYLILCEGIFDVFGWWRAGFTNAVAAFGKYISRQQAEILTGLRPAVIFVALDADAHLKNYEFFEKYGHIAKVLIVDMKGGDADELGRADLLSRIRNARPYRWEDKILSCL